MNKRYWLGVGAVLAVVLAAGGVLAGELTPPGPPGATMRTLQEIYDRIEAIGGYVGYEGGDAAAGEILAGKKAWVGGTEVTGTMPNVGQQNVTPGTSAHPITQGYHDGTGTVAGDADLMAVNIKSGVTIFGVAGTVVESTGNATAAQVLSGATFSKAGEAGLTGTMPNVGRQNVTPGTSAQPITQGYHDGTGTVAGDADLMAVNIRKDVDIFGVAGTMLNAAVPRTGQTATVPINPAPAGSDGDLQRGVAWPEPRFTVSTHGTDQVVTDNLTGLMWVKAPHSLFGNSGGQTWNNAIDFCNGLSFAGHSDWRLPNVRELQSLIDYGRFGPALPAGHPFTGVQSANYWSSSTTAANMGNAWYVYLVLGHVGSDGKTYAGRVWPVRAGQ